MTEAIDSQLRKYEAVVVLHPDANEEEQKSLFRKNKEIIKSFQGEVNHLDTWGKRRLANPVEKMTRGTYFHTTFTAKGNCIAELERTMRINDKVLRFVHMRLDDRINLVKFVDQFKTSLVEALKRESEREAKAQARRAQMSAARSERGDRGDSREGGSFNRRRDEGRNGGGIYDMDEGDMD
ncbi:MAG: 30S ribosomal protein S6 [Bdellovibrionales bacterium]|nr:30S ribosomal protein S6 [Bdellovibrionales bacterium]